LLRVPMALPQGPFAFCSDVGIPAAQGAAMLSVLQASAFVSRQFWGWMADRVGGLLTLLAGSACQTLAIAAFMLTQDEAGLFAVSAAFGLGFSGIVPAYADRAQAHRHPKPHGGCRPSCCRGRNGSATGSPALTTISGFDRPSRSASWTT
jgi:hypothetical protein